MIGLPMYGYRDYDAIIGDQLISILKRFTVSIEYHEKSQDHYIQYKDEKGNVYAVSVKCPHLGCQLEWNPDEISWDCPCHGSRFDFRGVLLSGPAQENISHG